MKTYNIDAGKKNTRLALIGILSALCFAFSYIEMLIPVYIGIPGVKLGFCNLIILLTLEALGAGYAALVSFFRVFVSFLLFGSLTSFLFSLSGAALSLVVMSFSHKTKFFGTVGTSLLGGVFHNVGQLAAASLLGGSLGLMSYLPVLLVSGCAAGCINGVLVELIGKRVKITEKTR